MDDKPPDQYRFKDYKQEVETLVKEIDTTFSVDPGRIGSIIKKPGGPKKYFSTLNKLKKYIGAKVNICSKTKDKFLSIYDDSQLENLRKCLEVRLSALNHKILPLGLK